MKGMMIGVALLMLGWGLSGCNTLQGLGKDIEAGGAAIQRAVE